MAKAKKKPAVPENLLPPKGNVPVPEFPKVQPSGPEDFCCSDNDAHKLLRRVIQAPGQDPVVCVKTEAGLWVPVRHCPWCYKPRN